MRRSKQVIAPILASAAVALLSGCKPEMQRCVDESNHVADPAFCKSGGNTRVMTGVPHSYRWYYGGGGSYVPGTVVGGGRYAPAGGHSYSETNGTARGGFGSSFGGEGGGHAGGEGAGE
jgi:uncharacterized membrane protein YgcG